MGGSRGDVPLGLNLYVLYSLMGAVEKIGSTLALGLLTFRFNICVMLRNNLISPGIGFFISTIRR